MRSPLARLARLPVPRLGPGGFRRPGGSGATGEAGEARGRDAPAFDRRLLPPMMLGSVLNPVNSSILSVSLVPIGAAFGAPPAQTAWLVSALYLATAVGQPVTGRLIDVYGPRRLYLAGASLTGVAGVVGMLAPNLGVLIAARVLLGFGTCAGYPAAMHLIRGEAARTGRDSPAGVLAALAVANQTVAVIGPALGGLLIGLGGWRATLAVNVPLAAAGVLLGLLRLPRADATPPPAGVGDREGHRTAPAGLDAPGMLLFSAMLVSLLLFLMAPRAGAAWLLLVCLGAGAGFAVRESRVPAPFIDLRVLGGNLPLVTTYVRALLAYVVSYAFLYGYTQWMEQGRGLSASRTGLAQLPLFATAIAVSTLTGRRHGVRGKLMTAALGQIAACVMLLFLGPGSPWQLLIAVALVVGVPQGLASLALQNSVYHQAGAERIGSSAGLLRTFGYLGAIVASAANGAFFPHRADTAGLHHLAWFLLAVSTLFLAVTVVDRSTARVGAAVPAGRPAAPPAPPPTTPAGAPVSGPARRSAPAPMSPPASASEKGRAMTRSATASASGPATTPDAPRVRATALLVMDLQHAILQAVEDPGYVPRVAGAIAAARAAGVPVVYVVIGFRPGHVDISPRNAAFAALPGDRFTGDDPGAAIHPDVAPLPGDTIVTKKRVSAFAGSDLELVLRSAGVEHLVLTGVATSGVVLSTLRQAADLDFRLTVLSDACHDRDREVHDVLTGKVFPRQAQVVTTGAWADSLAATAS